MNSGKWLVVSEYTEFSFTTYHLPLLNMIYDSHAHLISDDHERYQPAPSRGTLDAGALDNPVTAEKLLSFMEANGVAKALLVQRATIYGYDNSYIVESAAKYPDRFKAMCAINTLDANAPAQARHWIAEKGAAGVRMMAAGKSADADFFASPVALKVWETAARLGSTIRLHFFRWNRAAGIAALLDLLPSFPDTKIVVEHLTNMTAENGAPDYGVDDKMLELVSFPNVYLMFSTINLGRLKADAQPSAPVIARVVKSFEADRLMWSKKTLDLCFIGFQK